MDEAATPREWVAVLAVLGLCVEYSFALRVILVDFRPPCAVAGVHFSYGKGITMSELRERMIRDLKLADRRSPVCYNSR